MGAPLPLDAMVDVHTGPASPSLASPPSGTGTGGCDDIQAKVNALGLNIKAVVCLGAKDSLPAEATAPPANPPAGCPDVDAKIRALGLNIRAVVCLRDGIQVFADVTN
ncbi:hypothetical protein K493DRAFT_298304 [Basidiobolus meristosporus CBS 931.73]|uniref:Uncharacterized protein n=1 Tax=Basidiobolus meristosporus CBS 931.73 TaxID=1314790 RepID=A0A1Y1VPK8_9FUNG|nr:hypothetical protein K493DRAFT_309792 [Basidiobolus meristosporus CBS 931.73]ORX64768.1 hypothetical protein K493DRAFT_309516 [Basidiobolus meristosporus CBS 931.73]ORY01647.1 hypothetical protein K493DRAFT_298304 [Basidiobolus meristosporus CBS 931.73]|eukprot:ORX63241.1 hypothetical protein K493DRAFT_309792 [Basidiobolus meristosporus CBS 931.73]